MTGALLVLLAGSAGAGTYSEAARVARINATLDALRAISGAGLHTLEDELHAGARASCRSAQTTPQARCLVPMARGVCATRSATARRSCQLIADVIITNLLSEREFVPVKRRFELMNDPAGFRAAMRRELLNRYAVLVARMSLGRGFDPGAGLGASIDRFCRAHVRTRSLTWARCVAAVTWYVGVAHKPTPKPAEGKP